MSSMDDGLLPPPAISGHCKSAAAWACVRCNRCCCIILIFQRSELLFDRLPIALLGANKTKRTETTQTMLKVAAAGLVGGVVYSELAHNVERKITPISETSSILPHEIFPGPKEDSPAIFFLHGWPDDVLLFRKYAKELCKEYFCVNCTLPGYPTPPNFQGNRGNMPQRNWGFDFDEAMRSVKSTIDFTCAGHMDKVGVTLILHDWGCVIGNLVVDEYFGKSLKLHRMINMDVGGLANGMNAGVFLTCLAYQAPLNLFWMLPERLGDMLTALESLILLRTEPPGEENDKPSPVTASMNWPYRTAWKEIFTRGEFLPRALEFKPRANVPILFLSATDRPTPMRFYDEEYLRLVTASTPQSRYMFVQGNHWFPNQHARTTMQLVVDWLKETQGYSPTAKL